MIVGSKLYSKNMYKNIKQQPLHSLYRKTYFIPLYIEFRIFSSVETWVSNTFKWHSTAKPKVRFQSHHLCYTGPISVIPLRNIHLLNVVIIPTDFQSNEK